MTQTGFDLNRSAITFDTLGYFDRLRAVGVPEPQAKVQADAIRELIEDKLATKQDLREMECRLEVRFKEIDAKLETKIKELELRLQAEAQKNKYDLLKWQIGIGFALVAVMAKGFGWLGF